MWTPYILPCRVVLQEQNNRIIRDPAMGEEYAKEGTDLAYPGLWLSLIHILTPFAPDQSGAVSVFYEFGGIIVICDAGGCTGNICGFDEPRWFESKSALFSAGLRDMDAILGRDDRLVEKLADAATKLDAKFAAIIGTPVPAVIGTDYHALKRMTEKKVNLPIMTVDTDGMELYDKMCIRDRISTEIPVDLILLVPEEPNWRPKSSSRLQLRFAKNMVLLLSLSSVETIPTPTLVYLLSIWQHIRPVYR